MQDRLAAGSGELERHPGRPLGTADLILALPPGLARAGARGMPRPIHRAGPSEDPPLHRPDRTAIDPAAPPLLIEEARFALDSPLERNGFHSFALIGNSSWFRPSSGDLPAHGHPSSCRPRRTDRVVGRGPERPHSPPGSGGVTPRSRCRRCERVAEPKVRIRSPSSGESVSHIDQAGAGRELRLSRGCAPLGWRRGRQRRRPAPGVQSTRGGDGHDPGLLLRRKVTSR